MVNKITHYKQRIDDELGFLLFYLIHIYFFKSSFGDGFLNWETYEEWTDEEKALVESLLNQL